MEQETGNRALIAIFVSRFEAIEIASMLRGYGLHASVDAEHHAAIEYISTALGGHRLYVFHEDYEVASEILRQCGVGHDQRGLRAPKLALKLFVAYVAAFHAVLVIIMITLASASPAYLGLIPVSIYSTPVNPKGRADYFLSAETG